MGMSLASIFVIYTGASIARVFFISAGTFAAMSLYGYTTKRDLTGFGSFLFMGLIGIIIASVVNIFVQSSMLHFVVSVLGVLIFVGLTAYDTQKIKHMYDEADASEIAGKKALIGALSLYLDFINLFLMLLRLFGSEVRVVGPRTLLPLEVETLGVRVFDRIEEALRGADVVMVLRIQSERLEGALLPSLREYARTFGIGPAALEHAKPDAIVMHPGPINRGVEIDSEVAGVLING